jgi:hypothetical protein
VPVREIMTIPLSDSGIPTTIFLVIFSFKKIVAKITVKIGMVAMMRLAADGDIYNSP